MCPATPDQPDEGEDLMSLYIAEAGDPHVEPPPEHVARLRSLLLERLEPSPPPPTLPPRSAWRPRARLLVGSGLAATVVSMLMITAFGRPAIGWAQVAKALQERPWVHSTMSDPDGKKLVQQWFSMNGELSGERVGTTISFYDHKRRVFTKYVAAESAIFRLTDAQENTTIESNFLQPVLEGLRDAKGPGKFPILGMELISQTRREITESKKRWLEIELRFGGGPLSLLSVRIRVDPATKLPASIALAGEDGNWYIAAIDYPEDGPADIYDLGAPRAAKVVDGMFSDDVRRVLAGLRAGRRDFDDYFAFVVEERLLPINMLPVTTVHRVWRKELKFRVERLHPKRLDWAPPPDADMTWWKEHQGDFKWVPKLICNGTEYWGYYVADKLMPDRPGPQPGLPNGRGYGPVQLLRPGDDDLFLPYWCLDVLPEQAGYPPSRIDTVENYREFLVEPRASRGPPGTILLRGRDTSPFSARTPDRFRMWVDPQANYLSMRTETRVDESPEVRRSLDPPEVAYVGVHILEAVEKSPKGDWYPTRSRQITHNGEHELGRKFFVDFEAEMPDELFQPLK